MSRITTPIQPFSDTFRRELVGMADSIEWWDRYRGEMERLVSEPRQFDQDNRSVTRFKVFEVTGSAVELADGRWSYTMVEVAKATDGYGGWSTLSGGISTNFGFNFYEDMNDGSGTEGNGVDVDGQDFPANFSIQPVPVGTIVLAYRVYPQNGSDVEWWFSYVNAVDGQCDDPPVGSLDQPMIYVGKATSTTSTSASYADITSMDDPAVQDTVAFAFNKTNGYVTVGGGTYRVRVVANATTASADSTVAIKAVYNVNGGSFSDVPMTEIKQELSVLAANAVRIESNGYITVGSGDTSLIKMQIKRESGTGTPTLAANQHFIEVTRIDA